MLAQECNELETCKLYGLQYKELPLEPKAGSQMSANSQRT
jgi:hypothetical protein